MDLLTQTLETIKNYLDFISQLNVFLIILFLFILYHALIISLKDLKKVKIFRKVKDPESILIEDLKSIPLVNIILPAWKEGENLKQCLFSILNLTYPKLRVIVNAGGNDETLQIADTFKQYSNFIILKQKGGKSRPSLGKVKAINECLPYIGEGLVYFIDADAIITDEILIRLIHPIVNLGKNVASAGRRPLKSKENDDLSNYITISRATFLRFKYSRDDYDVISGSNTMVKSEVINTLGKFSENKKIATDRSMAIDIREKGFKIYNLKDYRAYVYDAGLPYNYKMFKRQRIVWNTNFLIYSYKFKKIRNILKFCLLIFVSLYLFIFPFLFFVNLGLFLIGIYFLIWILLMRVRRIIINKLITEKRFYKKLTLSFFIKLPYFIYMELFINVILIFDLFKFIRNLKTKNLKN